MPCPICQSQTHVKFRPFCSVECANRDLHNWVSEVYTLEGEENDADEDGIFGTDAKQTDD